MRAAAVGYFLDIRDNILGYSVVDPGICAQFFTQFTFLFPTVYKSIVNWGEMRSKKRQTYRDDSASHVFSVLNSCNTN